MVHFKEDYDFTVPYHFHLRQHEYMRVTKGYMDFTVSGKKTRQTPGMEDLHIPAGAKHGFRKPKGVETEMEERAVDDGGRKPTFFRNFFVYGDVSSWFLMNKWRQ